MNEIEQLTQLSSEAVQSAIAEYSKWHFYDAISGVVFGLIILMSCALFAKKKLDKCEDRVFSAFILSCFAFVALICIFCNLPTVIAPKAEAIHCLINDIR